MSSATVRKADVRKVRDSERQGQVLEAAYTHARLASQIEDQISGRAPVLDVFLE